MKIVIYVDYSNVEFNRDFRMSNELIALGHNVFLAVNDNQFEELKKNCDKAILGFSTINSNHVDCNLKLHKINNIEDAIDLILS